MPELPEVETIKEILVKTLKGRVIKKVDVLRPTTIVGDANIFSKSLAGKTILDISRKGKFLIFFLSDDLVMLSHLRMEGKYIEGRISHYARVVFTFNDNRILSYDDSRSFGILMLKNKSDYLITPPLSQLGQEPMEIKNIDSLYEIFQSKKIPIKETILDQHILSGLGNIYADEVLFLSKIHPETPTNLLSKKQVSDIVMNSVITLNKAIKAGGSTIHTYHPADGVDGNFQQELQVYDQKGKPCPRCGTPLDKIFVGGRGTTFCPICQVDHSLPYVIGLTGPIGSGKGVVSNVFAESGFHILNSDEVVKNLYKDKTVIDRISKMFSLKCLLNGEIDKNYIKNIVINNSKKKLQLERYIHPLVKLEIKKFIKNYRPNEYVLLEVPLLFESGLNYLCNKIITIEIDKLNQEKNLKKRGSNVEESIKLNENFDYVGALKKADYVIKNNSDMISLIEQTKKVIYKVQHQKD